MKRKTLKIGDRIVFVGKKDNMIPRGERGKLTAHPVSPEYTWQVALDGKCDNRGNDIHYEVNRRNIDFVSRHEKKTT